MNLLLACRVCLAYDTRLCSIMDVQFRDIYEKLVEASLDTEEMLPTSVCYICFSLMKKMLQFRDRSQKTNQILQQMLSSGLELSVNSLDRLVKDQTGISWTLEISNIERTSTTSGEVEFKVKIESVESEMDIDRMSDRNEDYSDSMPVCRDSTSDSEDDLPLHNISEQRKTDRVKILEIPNISGYEGAAPHEKRKLDKNESENELVNIKTKKDEETRESKDKMKVLYFKDVEMATSNIISENQNQSVFNKNDTVRPPNDIFTCDLCKNEYQCKILLESHMKKSHVMVFTRKDSIISDSNVTNQCKSTNLLKLQDIQNNDNRKEKDRPEKKFWYKTSQYECPYCMKIFTRNFDLTKHLRVHAKKKPFKCDICEKGFSIRSNLTRHLRIHNKEKPFQCDICEKSFNRRSNLTTHLRVHTREKPEKPFQCDICEKSFAQRSHLTKHLTVHTREKPFKCVKCEKGFSSSSDLTRHLRVHTKEKPFKCDICEKSFTQTSSLGQHLRLHYKEKPFKCDIREKSFTQSSSLGQHLRFHNKEKPFKCDICEKSFTSKSYLDQHLRFHNKEKPFKCDICEKSFTSKSYLEGEHLRIHTKEKPFNCIKCEKSFSGSSVLTRHLRVHTKEKPFKCVKCEKNFSRSSDLTRHLRVHTKEKPFKCALCEKGFSLRTGLTRHLRVHTKEKPFKCEICKKCYSDKRNLNFHLRVHSKEK